MANKPAIYVTRLIPEKALATLHDECDLHIWEGQLPPPYEVIQREVANVEGLLALLTDKIDAGIMDAAPNLKVISNLAVGFDNIDIPAATARKIPVGNTPGILTETSADFAFGLLMAAARRIPEGAQFIKAGKWQTWEPMTLLGRDIYGATLGIVGMGRIGQAVARRAAGFNMKLLYSGNRKPEIEQTLGAEHRSFEALLRESDFVSLHVPLNKDTYHLMGAKELALMKTSAILINTARGGVVDPKALYEALKAGQIAYAALDVTEPEPIPLDDPLLTLENCLIVPHIASASYATREKMALMAVDNLLAGLRGERLPNCVNAGVYGETSP